MENYRRTLLKRTINQIKSMQWARDSFSASTLEELLSNSTVYATKLFHCSICTLLTLEDDKLVLKSHTGIRKETIQDFEISLDGSFTGGLIRRGEPVLIKEISKYMETIKDNRENYYIGSIIASPLVFNQNITGLIIISDPQKNHAFNSEDVQRLITYANQTAFAIQCQEQVNIRTRELRESNERLTDALNNIKTLKGLIPICASCKKIRDDSGYWEQVEIYIRNHSDAEFSHGICPSCAKKIYGAEIDIKDEIITYKKNDK